MSQAKAAPYFLKALGRGGLPERIRLAGRVYARVKVFKHDFFAATGLYEEQESEVGSRKSEAKTTTPRLRVSAVSRERFQQIVLKVERTEPLFGVPMAWLGRFLAKREMAAYRKLDGLRGVPALVGPWEKTGLAHAYVEGEPLKAGRQVDDLFFPGLLKLLTDLHARGVAYADLEKRENILAGADGRAHLIDFQISWSASGRFGPGAALFRLLKKSDRYHLMKHWRRHRPDQLAPCEIAENRRRLPAVRIHTFLFRPITMLRRRLGRRIDPTAGDSLKRSGI